jgi:hypothetical protein
MASSTRPEEESQSPAERKRKAERIDLRTFVHFRQPGYHRTEVTLLDISPTGCRLDLPERATVGQIVWVTLPGLQPIESRVVWLQDWIAGLAFASPLYPAVYDALVARLRG